MRIRQYLELDVARTLDILFHVQIAIAECSRGLTRSLTEQCG